MPGSETVSVTVPGVIIWVTSRFTIDFDLVVSAALLHDIVKFVDVKNESFSHSKGASELFNALGYEKIAKIIEKHDFEGVDKLKTLEEKIVNYADKRVLHDKIVTLDVRFEDGAKRYNIQNTDEALYKPFYALEKELFEPIDIGPEDIK